VDDESAAWLRDLAGAGARAAAGTPATADAGGAPGTGADDEPVARLHGLLLRAARAEATRRGPRYALAGPDLDDLAHQAADDACLAVLRKLDQFRGDSRFTTWAYSFAVLEVSSKVSRHMWGERPLPGDEVDWERLPDRLGVDPAQSAEAAELARAVVRAVDEELTPHQRRVFAALVLDGAPLDVVVTELGTTRGAVYKTIFDARRKIRAALVANGFLVGVERGGGGATTNRASRRGGAS